MEELLDAFEALANENRIKIFKLLLDPSACAHISAEERKEKKICVCRIVEAFDMAESTISHHLACLRRAGLITCEKRGTWVFYSVDWDGVKTFRNVITETLKRR